jgi:hypothetical protein
MKNIFKLILLPLCFLSISQVLLCQSLRTRVIKFDINTFGKETTQVAAINQDELEIFMFPNLNVNVNFSDANNDGILEALEAGDITIEVYNSGGKADTVEVLINPVREINGLVMNDTYFNTSIGSEEKKIFNIPIKATIDIPTDSVLLNISVKENIGGFDAVAQLQMSTYEFQGANLKIVGVRIVDSGKNLRPVKADGMMQKGETVMAYVTIQNVGQGVAEDVNYSIKTTDPNAFLLLDRGPTKEIDGKIKNLLLGESIEIPVRLSTNYRYQHIGDYLPFVLSMSEKFHRGDIIAENLPIPYNQAPEKAKLITVVPDLNKLNSLKKTQLFSESDKFSSNIKFKDITSAPLGAELYPNAIAVVIGAGTNSNNIPPAPYAANDAVIMEQYFRNTMGIHNIMTVTDAEVTRSKLLDIFNPNGDLSRYVLPDSTDVFVYYSGHGIPDKDDDGNLDVYLIPDDCRKDMLRERGYSLNKMYANLNDLKAKSVTVILDACFSGSSKQSSSLSGESISNMKGVEIEIEDLAEKPWMDNPNFRVMTSSSGDQTSLAFDKSQSGLFTYYLALGMQGDADSNKDKKITVEELNEYVSAQVSKAAKQIRDGNQTPQLLGNGNLVIVQF